MAYKKKSKGFMTKEEKNNLIDKYQKQIDEHLLSIVNKVSDYFVEENEKGIPIWESDVFDSSYHNPETGTQYNFENSIILWAASKFNNYKDTRFVTAKQGFDAGLSMEKGTTGHFIVQRFGMPMFPLIKRDDNGEIITDPKTNKPVPERDENGKIKYMYKRVSKLVKVFNVEQFTGELPARWNKKQGQHIELENESELNLFKKALENSSEVKIKRHQLGDNYYSPAQDLITLSEEMLFKNTLNEISVMAHEMSHSTGHKDRLNRESLYRYGEDKSFRGFEELVANFSARAITDKYGLSKNEFNEAYQKNHDAYDAGWMKHVLNKEPILIFEATKQAELAYRMVNKNLETELKKIPELKDLYFPDKKEKLEVEEFLNNKEKKENKPKRKYKK